jgi:Protein kinase domain
MQRSPGATIGSYEIRSVLGKGGMGEVYLAHDRKLVRDVAVKTLPAEFAGDLERLARFQREARMLAALNHPNIAAIYGLEESEGDSFLVLELVGRDAGRVAPTQGAAAVERSALLHRWRKDWRRPTPKGLRIATSSPPISRSHPKDG